MNTEPLARPRRLRWQLIAVTLALAWLGGSLVWWFSPAGVQWRLQREAQRWVNRIENYMAFDPSHAKWRFELTTDGVICVFATDATPADIKELERIVMDLKPRCGVVLISAYTETGEALDVKSLFNPHDL